MNQTEAVGNSQRSIMKLRTPAAGRWQQREDEVCNSCLSVWCVSSGACNGCLLRPSSLGNEQEKDGKIYKNTLQ
jgi:hypothetical protein